MFDLTDRVAIITGASGNLGSAVAATFRSAGAQLVLVDRQAELLYNAFPELIDEPDCLLASCADLTNPSDVDQVMSETLERFGRVDILINTVGGFRSGTPLHETPRQTWDFMMTLNSLTVFITSQAVIPHMIRQGAGKIIHLAARPGLKGRANMAAYSASKATVIRMTESMADELKDQGINVNCILPGTIDTPQNRDSMPDADYDLWVQPESLADVIWFLCSEGARDIHGAAIPVFGRT